MPEYLEFRCCMCPNIHEDPQSDQCPAWLHKKQRTPCRFVKVYEDKRGWKYRVLAGLGESNYKARYQKPDKSGLDGWHCVRQLQWRKTFDQAQRDLNLLAAKNNWLEVKVDG